MLSNWIRFLRINVIQRPLLKGNFSCMHHAPIGNDIKNRYTKIPLPKKSNTHFSFKIQKGIAIFFKIAKMRLA